MFVEDIPVLLDPSLCMWEHKAREAAVYTSTLVAALGPIRRHSAIDVLSISSGIHACRRIALGNLCDFAASSLSRTSPSWFCLSVTSLTCKSKPGLLIPTLIALSMVQSRPGNKVPGFLYSLIYDVRPWEIYLNCVSIVEMMHRVLRRRSCP